MVDLEELRSKVSALGERVKELKASGSASQEAISAAVAELLDAKKTFAENNNGIGVDGKHLDDGHGKKSKSKVASSGETTAPKKEVRACLHFAMTQCLSLRNWG
jgi:uncharacterized protein YoaH (UPF0181 family)